MTTAETIYKQREREIRAVERGKGRLADRFWIRVVGVSFVPTYPGNLHRLAEFDELGRQQDERPTVVLVRNPTNEYDANAIEVHAPALGDNGMIGHIPRSVAARLAPEMDDGVQFVAGVEAVWINPAHEDRPGISIQIDREGRDIN